MDMDAVAVEASADADASVTARNGFAGSRSTSAISSRRSPTSQT
jgi:hypothetical protein